MASHVIEGNGSTLAQIAHAWTEFRARRAALRAESKQRARVARELATYTDRELFDLGISRDNIPEIINGTFRRT